MADDSAPQSNPAPEGSGKPGKPGTSDPAAAAAAAAAAGVPLTPEMLRQLMPRPRELLRAQRRLTWMMAGCFTLIIIAILAMLFVPWWEYKSQARELVKEHFVLIGEGKLDEAHAQTGMRREQFDAMLERLDLRDLLAGDAVIQIDDFTTEDGEAFVVGAIRPADDRDPRHFRVRVYVDSYDQSMKIERIQLDP